MACSRGAASPDSHTQRRLFAASAGYCQNPTCYSQLFADAARQSFHIAEMAHICAANDGGPRASPDLSDRHGRTPTQVVLTVGYFALTE
jgi:hypothetical protein